MQLMIMLGFFGCAVFVAVCRVSFLSASGGHSLVEVCGLLFGVASLVAEYRL